MIFITMNKVMLLNCSEWFMQYMTFCGSGDAVDGVLALEVIKLSMR